MLYEASSLYNQLFATGKTIISGLQPFAAVERENEEFLPRIQTVWARLCTAMDVLQRRLDDGMILPGTCTDAEVAFALHFDASLYKAERLPAESRRTMREYGATIGYSAALDCAQYLLGMLGSWNRSQDMHDAWISHFDADRAKRFILAAIGLIPSTTQLETICSRETLLVDFLEKDESRFLPLSSPMSCLDHAFRAAVVAKWRSPAVVGALRSRGLLGARAPNPEVEASTAAARAAREREDIAAKGFRRCALPSCGLREATIRQFKVCSASFAVAYCSAEHAALHWADAHRRECKALKAAGAKPLTTTE